jgi:hypothetical protein
MRAPTNPTAVSSAPPPPHTHTGRLHAPIIACRISHLPLPRPLGDGSHSGLVGAAPTQQRHTQVRGCAHATQRAR